MPCKDKTNVVTIDGPAGSGKSTVAKELARRLGFLYVDTGAMYRALTLKALKEKVNLDDQQALAKVARNINIELQMEAGSLKVRLDGEDASRAIREQALTEKVVLVARIAGVREQMVKLQRRLAGSAKNGAVLEGRDIGSVVFPDARYKFYLDARLDERIKRRYKELKQMGQDVEEAAVAGDIERRDRSDMARTVAPLVKPKDATCIDTTDLAVSDVVEQILKRISARCSI